MPNVMHPRMFSEELTTKRGVVSGVTRTAPADYITTPVRCSVVMPLDPTAQQESIARGVSVDWQIFCDPADIVPEDIIVVGTEEFNVVEVAPWPRINPRVMHITLREYQE